MHAKVAELFPEGNLMENTRLYEKLDTKLDDLLRGQGNVVADVARVEGTQKGLLASIDTLSKAIGDVMQTRIEAATTVTLVNTLTERVTALEKTRLQQDLWERVDGLVKWAVAALMTGGGYAAAQHYLK